MNNDTTILIGLDTHKSLTQVSLLEDNRGKIDNISYKKIYGKSEPLIILKIEVLNGFGAQIS